MANTLGDTATASLAEAGHQQHPLKVYLIVWGLLFVLSTASYMVDFIGFQGYLRWTLILIFMIMKASMIVAFFMHMKWERLALSYAILLPPIAVLIFVSIMVFESDYTLGSRITYFGAEGPAVGAIHGE